MKKIKHRMFAAAAVAAICLTVAPWVAAQADRVLHDFPHALLRGFSNEMSFDQKGDA